VVEYLSFC